MLNDNDTGFSENPTANTTENPIENLIESDNLSKNADAQASRQNTINSNEYINDAVKSSDEMKSEAVDTVTQNNGEPALKESDPFEEDKKKHWKIRATGFLSGQAVSMFGSMLVQHAIIFYLTLTYKSGTIMMLSALCGFLPQIIISLFSGVFADRLNRKMLIIFSDSLIAAATLVLALIFMSGYKELWLILTVMGIRSLCSGIQSPAVNALIPQIAPKDKLAKLNGIMGSIQSMVMLVSPVLAAAVLAVSNLEIIFFIDVVTAIAAVAIMFVLHAPQKQRDNKKIGYFDDLKSGLKFIIREKPLRSFLVYWTMFMFLLTPVMFLPAIHIARVFGSEEWRLALNEMAFGLGALVSGIIISAWGGFKSRLKTLFLGCVIFSFFALMLGLGENTFKLIFGKPVFGSEFFFAAFLVFMFLSGAGMPFVNVPGMTLIQEYVEPSMHGRIFGLLQIISASAIPVGSLLCGPLADLINIEIIFISSGLLLLLLCALMARDKNVKRFEIKKTADIPQTDSNSII